MNSCYKCLERHVGCHADCAKYAADSIKREEAKAADKMLCDYRIKSMWRKGVI